MQIYGKDIDFKLSSLKDSSALELALKNMKKNEDKIRGMKAETPMSEALMALLMVFRDFFKDATGEDVLEECQDVEEAKQVYIEFMKMINEQKKKILAFSLDDIK